MKMIDFEYDGVKLSSQGFMVCDFDSSDEFEIGNMIELAKIKGQASDKFFNAGYSYEDTFNPTFYVMKNGCKTNGEFEIKPVELNDLLRWLNRDRFLKFKPIYDDGSFAEVYYLATFNISLMKMGSLIIGLSFQMNTNAPYGFQEPVGFNHKFAGGDTFVINDKSDKIGFVYGDLTIKCLGAGDLIVKNDMCPNNDIVIKNCKLNETITLHGDTKIIQSDLLSHTTLPNDFNYNFFKVSNTYDNRDNTITVNLPCEFNFNYSPIRKVGVIL